MAETSSLTPCVPMGYCPKKYGLLGMGGYGLSLQNARIPTRDMENAMGYRGVWVKGPWVRREANVSFFTECQWVTPADSAPAILEFT